MEEKKIIGGNITPRLEDVLPKLSRRNDTEGKHTEVKVLLNTKLLG